ncbi:MAG: lipocalin family protein [Bacteroidia bacterium]
MNKLNVLLIVFATALAFTACQNPEKILPSNEGTWLASSGTYNEFRDDVPTVTDSTLSFTDVSYQFNEDGTGSHTENNVTTDFDWVYDKDTEQLTITEDVFPQVFDVLKISKNEMTLYYEFDSSFFGTITKYEYTINLTKTN